MRSDDRAKAKKRVPIYGESQENYSTSGCAEVNEFGPKYMVNKCQKWQKID